MEKGPICKQHGKPIQTICISCNVFLCFKCQTLHTEKGCKGSIDIPSYATKTLLNEYKTRMDNLKDERTDKKNFAVNISMLSKTMKKELEKLKQRLVDLNSSVSEILQILDSGLNYDSIIDAKKSLAAEYKKLAEAIATENMGYIIKKLIENESDKTGNTTECLLEKINKLIIAIVNSGKLKNLMENLRELISIHLGNKLLKSQEILPIKEFESQKHHRKDVRKNSIKEKYVEKPTPKFFDKEKSKEDWEMVSQEKPNNNAIYGICYPQSTYQTLCKYDINLKKLIPSITVPKWATITQINNRIFVSGGAEPVTNIFSEYIEPTNNLIKKESMNHSKYSHRIEVINSTYFISVGGYDGISEITYCEGYSTKENKWINIPSLNKGRSDAATALLNGFYLYAINGEESENMIEFLNINEMKMWQMVKLNNCEIAFPYSSVSFPISKVEIMILHGLDSGEVGIFDVKNKTIKKWKLNPKSDDYYSNSVKIIDNKAYVIGGGGHIHIYDINKGKFEDMDYENIFS